MKFRRRVSGAVRLAAAGCAAALLSAGCITPVNDPSDDYIEFESVWQYLKTYSIYQDSSIYQGRVPADPFVFSSPEALMRAINDTLYGEYYTRYAFATGDASSGNVSAAIAAARQSVVFLDTLTDSTVRISIRSFVYGVTYNEFLGVLPGVRLFPNVIVDVRGNGGGDIDDATLIINAFVPSGTSYIMARERAYDVKAHSARTVNWHPWKTENVMRPELKGKKVTVLMDHGSASSSEILIAALKDCDSVKATLVGSRTYGKGIGQIKVLRRDRPALQITFLQMRGVTERIGSYHHKGIDPDVAASGTDVQQLLAAVQVHEPSVGQLRRLRKQFPDITPTPVAGYRIVYEE